MIITLVWLEAITKTCFIPYGMLLAFLISILATIQFLIMIKTSYSAKIGNSKWKPGPIDQPNFTTYMIQMIIEKFPILAPHQHHGNSNVGQHGPGGVHLNKASRRVHDIDPMKDKFPRIVSIQ